MSNSNCAAQKYLTKEEKHDQVKHLGLRISDWTRRLKSDELEQHVQYQLRSAAGGSRTGAPFHKNIKH